jgi:hypothetical protein
METTSDTAELDDLETPQRLDEALKVLLWRTHTLARAGYNQAIAFELALTSSVDLHAATALIARGCPQETAVRILV